MIKSILLPTDGSETSEKSIEYAIQLGKQFGAKIVVVHVYGVNGILGGGFRRGAALFDTMRQELEAEASEIVSQVAERVRQNGLAVDAVAVEGSAADGIIHAIDEIIPDIVVMGSRGAGGFAGLPLGSVAEMVVRHSKVPVLVVK